MLYGLELCCIRILRKFENSVLFASSKGLNFLTTDHYHNYASLAGHKKH